MGQSGRTQRGGTFLGFILGLLVGLGAALAVAVYVTKVPIPFMTKTISRGAEQDANEALKNKNWDPNAPLYGKNPAKPQGSSESVVAPEPVAAPVAKASAAKVDPKAKVDAKPEAKPVVTADPLGDLAKARASGKDVAPPASAASAGAADAASYFVQLGAFRTPEDAEAQRAKLSLSGVETKLSEREQAGRTVYRVRVGPFAAREEADKAKAKLDALGLDTALVRVLR